MDRHFRMNIHHWLCDLVEQDADELLDLLDEEELQSRLQEDWWRVSRYLQENFITQKEYESLVLFGLKKFRVVTKQESWCTVVDHEGDARRAMNSILDGK